MSFVLFILAKCYSTTSCIVTDSHDILTRKQNAKTWEEMERTEGPWAK